MATLSEILKTMILNPIDFTKDSYLAYKRLNDLHETGKRLVNKYGSGAGNGIDNYYHSLLHCELGQKGHKKISEVLGDLREAYDYNKKVYLKGMPEEVIKDSIKDLTNNEKGYILGAENPSADCRFLLDDKRTRRMKDEGIW